MELRRRQEQEEVDEAEEEKEGDVQNHPFSEHLAVDLGCGTGLAGAALRSRCKGRLVGCDLSKKMLAVARKKANVYDSLDACDAVAYLHRHIKPATADLIVAADVFVYMRDLSDLFDEVATALRPGGFFAFSTEKATTEETGGVPSSDGGKGWVERPSERIAHSEEYLRWLAASQFRVCCLRETVVRRDSGTGLPGHLAVLVKVAN